jgi:general secretion pathway protein F
MPVYAYKGLTAGNRKARGMIDAESVRSARTKLRSEGIFPTDIALGRTKSAASDLLQRLELPQLRRVPDLDLALFTNQLATLIGAGVPLVESLGALTDQIENERLKSVVGRLRESVNEGSSLADGMGEHEHVFDLLYRSMVRAGESAGALELVLRRLGSYVESRMELRSKVRAAMTYPVLMLVASVAVLSVLLVKVIPTIAGLLEDMNQELPFITSAVLAVSDFLRTWGVPLLIVIAAVILLINRLIQTESGRLAWDRGRLRMPLLGRTVRYISVSRFARTLATLLAGGVQIVQALDIAKTVTGNAVIAEAVEGARDSIMRGATIAGPLRQSGEFPPMVTHMISVGEASGELDAMLSKVSDTYDELVENALNRMTTLLGPILLILVAGVVLLVILSTLLPLMNLTNALQ